METVGRVANPTHTRSVGSHALTLIMRGGIPWQKSKLTPMDG